MGNKSEDRFEDQVMGDVASLLSFWPLVMDDFELGPDVALRILATWAHLRRFAPETLEQAIKQEIDSLVDRDSLKLVAFFSQLSFLDDWLVQAGQLDESWDWIIDNDSAEEANLIAIRLFETLDQFSQASYAVERVLAGLYEKPSQTDILAIKEEIACGERFLAENPDVFLGAAVIASARLGRYRPDLLEVDHQLWETTLKHRALEELLEERNSAIKQFRLSLNEIEELRPSSYQPRSLQLNSSFPSSSNQESSMTFSKAAGSGQWVDVLIDQLASQSPSDTPTNDYRRAWAHFLASAYGGTDPAAWRDEFLRLIEGAGPLDDDWKERKRRTEDLAQGRDWMRRLADKKAFTLEPRPLSSVDDLLRWLHELVTRQSPPEPRVS